MKVINTIQSKLECNLRGLSPKRVTARLNGPRIIANSVPKAGTHLLIRCLSLFPRLTYTGIHYTKGSTENGQLESLLKRTGKSRFSAAHLWWSSDGSRLLKGSSFKSFLMLRDPRDVVISGVFFILRRQQHRCHEYFSSLPGMDARITASITGVDASRSSTNTGLDNISDRFSRFTPWIGEEYNLLVLYENLIGSKGGGNAARQIEEIKKISRHIDQPLLPHEIIFIAQRTFSPRSATFRKGVSGEWAKYFTESHRKVFKDLAGHLLTKLGYEEDNDW